MPILRRLDFEYSKMPPYILMRDYFEFLRAIPLQRVGYIRVTHPLFYLSVLPFDLHVLGLPLAFILSQDQTLLCIFFISFFSFPVLGSIFGINFSLFPYLSDFLAHLLKELFRFRLPLPLFFPLPSPSLANAKLHLFSFSTTLFLTFFSFIFIPIDYHYFIPYSTLTPTPVFASSCPLPPLFFSFLYIVSTPFSHFPSFIHRFYSFFPLPIFPLFTTSLFLPLLLVLYLINITTIFPFHVHLQLE